MIVISVLSTAQGPGKARGSRSPLCTKEQHKSKKLLLGQGREAPDLADEKLKQEMGSIFCTRLPRTSSLLAPGSRSPSRPLLHPQAANKGAAVLGTERWRIRKRQ